MKRSVSPVRSLLAVALAVAAAPALAGDSPYSQTVFFGDSLTDSGHFRPALVQAVGPNGALLGRFTTNPGLVWSEYLAAYYGTDASTDNQGGSNYAVTLNTAAGTIALAATGTVGVWGWIGIVPLATGLSGWCPAYLPFGLSTCKTR